VAFTPPSFGGGAKSITSTLFARLSKCSFGLQQIDYLGHTVSRNGVAMDTTKVQTILDWPEPTNLKQLRGFLGITEYYRRFIKGYATITAPLSDLLKKDNFSWCCWSLGKRTKTQL